MTSSSYSHLARVVHNYLKEYDQAIYLYRKSIEINLELEGTNDCVAISYYNIGLVYIEIKEWEKALKCLEQSHEIHEERFGMEHFRTARVYNSIGEVHAEKGDYDTAMKFLDNALEIHKIPTENYYQSLEAAATYRVIGRVHEKKGDIDMALNYYSRSLRIYEKVNGMNHPETIKVYNHTSSAYAAKAIVCNPFLCLNNYTQHNVSIKGSQP
jgi:tetratricopeptide (TPR) repeat protein